MSPKLKAILRLEVPIIVQIGERDLPLEGVLSLAPGSIIELPKAADEELELLVNNKVIGKGIAVKVGENFGIRISVVGDVAARLEALAVVDDSTLAGAGADDGSELEGELVAEHQG